VLNAQVRGVNVTMGEGGVPEDEVENLEDEDQ
jgi:hypothetical protein